MVLKISVTDKEKVEFLEEMGYVVQLEPREFHYHCYHNQVEKETKDVYVVRNKGEEVVTWDHPSVPSSDWAVNHVFDQIIETRLKRMLGLRGER